MAPPLQHCSSVDSLTMTENLAPLHIYIYTKSYRNLKVWEWAVCEEGLACGRRVFERHSGSELPVNH